MRHIAIVVFVAVCITLAVSVDTIVTSRATAGSFPDSPVYMLTIARSKLVEKLLIRPTKRVEYDLLMADVWLQASVELMDKKEYAVAKKYALKGENYFSILVADYRTARGKKENISSELDAKIDMAYAVHQVYISHLMDRAPQEDAETYRQIDYFSKSNYQSLTAVRKSDEDNERL